MEALELKKLIILNVSSKNLWDKFFDDVTSSNFLRIFFAEISVTQLLSFSSYVLYHIFVIFIVSHI